MAIVTLGAIGNLAEDADDGDQETVSAAAHEESPTTDALPTTSPAPATSAATTSLAPPTTAAPTNADAPSDLLAALDLITVEREHGDGYERALFEHWIDADGDGCDTRQEVLSSEALTPGQGTCGIIAATWYSPFDDGEYVDPSELEIDHLVALKEAWDSGAWAWTADHRRAFANDLDHPEALVAVVSHQNQAKSDKDPSNWMPANEDAWCGYAADWVRVKVAWGLSMDESEAGRLRNVLEHCGPEPGTLVGARPVARPPSTHPQATASPSTVADAAYYPNCAAAHEDGAAPVRRGEPGYGRHLDRDGDGIGCE